MQNLDAKRAGRILIAQVVTTLIVSLIGLAFGLTAGFFALIGGATATIANGLFAWFALGSYDARDPGRILGQLYAGQVLKLGFVAIAFAAAILWLESFSPVAFFGAFFVVQVVPPMLANRLAG
jgi:F0F1-type ATP synthase assembly protein I